jgi:hypothetical protein
MAEQNVAQPAEILNSPEIDARLRVQQYIGELPLPDVLKSPAEIQGIGASGALDGSIVAEAKEISMGALEKTRFFVKEKAERIQHGWDALQTKAGGTKIGKIGVRTLAGAAILTAGTPVAQAAIEEAPIIKQLDKTTEAKATLHGVIPSVPSYESGGYQGDGGYPYAHAAPGTVDEKGYPVEQCAAYARWRLIQAGVNPERAVIFTKPESYQRAGEIVDRTPAVGSLALLVGGVEHVMYVEAYDDETGNVWVSEWNRRGNKYSMRPANIKDDTLDGAANFYYVHYELPAPSSPTENLLENTESFEEVKPAENFMGAKYDRQNKNTLTMRRPLKAKTFIQSPNGRFRLVQQGTSLDYWDTQGGYKKMWQKFLNGKKAPQLRIKSDTANNTKGRTSNIRQNFLVLGTARKEFLRIPIGTATRIVLGDDGKFSGYKGNGKTPVWENASTLPGMSRVAKAAARKANKSSKTSSISGTKHRRK